MATTPKFYTLKVADVRSETSECKSIAFELPKDLKDAFQYKQGQYLTLRAEINGEDIRRSYSLCSSPLDDEMRVAVKQIEDGRFSTYANQEIEVGDEIEVMTPMGKFFTEVHPDHNKTYVAFAAGSGITPVMSIIKTVLQTEPNSRFILLYANRNVNSIIFKDEIEGLKNVYLTRFQVYHFLDFETQDVALFNGRLDREKLEELFEHIIDLKGTDEFFICGPEPMIIGIKDTLADKGVDSKKVHFELFASPGAGKHKAQKKKRKPTGEVSLVTVKNGGRGHTFELSQGTNNILDAALLNGADLPFACKGGVCCTCKARVTEGEVEMEVNYALEPDEVAAGLVLTCQAFPKTPKVVVDFDQAL